MKILRNYPLELLQLMLICKNHTSEVNLVGGCVRDMLLNKQPKDFDIVGKYLHDIWGDCKVFYDYDEAFA